MAKCKALMGLSVKGLKPTAASLHVDSYRDRDKVAASEREKRKQVSLLFWFIGRYIYQSQSNRQNVIAALAVADRRVTSSVSRVRRETNEILRDFVAVAVLLRRSSVCRRAPWKLCRATWTRAWRRAQVGDARLIPKDLAMYVGLGGKDWRHSTSD